MWFRIKSAIKYLTERIKYSMELYLWEQEKKKEGFPKEWFEDIDDSST